MIYTTIDTIASTNRLRYADIRLKITFVITTLLITAASTSFIPSIIVFFTATVLIIAVARIRPATFLMLMLAPLLFGLAGLTVFLFSGQKEGISFGLLAVTRTIAGSSCLLFLILTTPATDLFGGLKWLRLPDVVIELAMIIYSYIFLFHKNAERMRHASRLRGENNFQTKITAFSMLAGTLFSHTIYQGEKLFTAMNSRCYDGDLSHIYKESTNAINIPALFSILIFEAVLAYVAIMTKSNMLI